MATETRRIGARECTELMVVVSTEWPKTKNDTSFLFKVFFGMVEKEGCTVFLESCALLKTLF